MVRRGTIMRGHAIMVAATLTAVGVLRWTSDRFGPGPAVAVVFVAGVIVRPAWRLPLAILTAVAVLSGVWWAYW